MIQTKICQADKDKLTKIADGFSMTIYQLLQALLLTIVRYFDSESIVTEEHNIMMNAFANAIFALLPTQNFGLFHGTCEGQCSWADFAKEIFRLGHL